MLSDVYLFFLSSLLPHFLPKIPNNLRLNEDFIGYIMLPNNSK